MNWDLYNKKIKLKGSNQRERLINDLKNTLNNKAINNPSCKTILINNVETNLIIDSGTKPQFKSIKTLPNEMFYLGDIIDYSNSKWLVIEADSDNEIYVDGKMQECNYQLKWQNSNGYIVERWIVSQNATAYNNGEGGNKNIVIGTDQLMIFIPFDEETVKLRRGKRFFIDNNIINPISYKLTRVDTTSYFKNGHGYICLIVTEDVERSETDRVDLMLCDYISPTTPDLPNPTNQGISEITFTSKTIKSGSTNGRKFSAVFKDLDNNIVGDIIPTWTITGVDISLLNIVKNGSDITIKVNNDDLIGSSFILKLKDSNSLYAETSITIDIIGLY